MVAPLIPWWNTAASREDVRCVSLVRLAANAREFTPSKQARSALLLGCLAENLWSFSIVDGKNWGLYHGLPNRSSFHGSASMW